MPRGADGLAILLIYMKALLGSLGVGALQLAHLLQSLLDVAVACCLQRQGPFSGKAALRLTNRGQPRAVFGLARGDLLALVRAQPRCWADANVGLQGLLVKAGLGAVEATVLSQGCVHGQATTLQKKAKEQKAGKGFLGKLLHGHKLELD